MIVSMTATQQSSHEIACMAAYAAGAYAAGSNSYAVGSAAYPAGSKQYHTGAGAYGAGSKPYAEGAAAYAGGSRECAPTPDAEHLSDEALILHLREASEQQVIDRLFEEIFKRYHARVLGWCYAVAKDREMAMDLTQEVFLKVYRNLHAFRGDSRISTWIYVIARNHCLNCLRKRDADPTDTAAQIPLNLEGENGLDAQRHIETAEAFRNTYRAIRSILTPMEVRVLWLHYGYELTLDAITRRLVLSNRSGAKAFIVSARRKLKLYFHNRGITPNVLSAAAGARTRDEETREYRAFAA